MFIGESFSHKLIVSVIQFICSYEVLGGLHTLIAKQQLSADYPDNPFFSTCVAEVYVGLNDEEALRLSQRHNETSHFTHKVTHWDLVSCNLHACFYPIQVYSY